MQDLHYTFTATLWKDPGASWYFITLPRDHAEEIKFFAHDAKHGFGSVRVSATIGESTWKTSVFPSKSAGTYLLPVKVVVRKKNKLHDGDEVVVKIDIVI